MQQTTRSLIRLTVWGLCCGAVVALIFAGKRRGRPNAKRKPLLTERQLDQMIEETFPASDAPSYE